MPRKYHRPPAAKRRKSKKATTPYAFDAAPEGQDGDVPAAGAAVFQTGPLAWDGLWSFWVRNGAYVAFVIVMFFVLLKAVYRQAVDDGVVAA